MLMNLDYFESASIQKLEENEIFTSTRTSFDHEQIVINQNIQKLS